MFPAIVERNYHSEYLLTPPDHIVQYVMPCIERRQWGFLMRRSQEANLSWVVEFYSNYHSPSLQSVYVRRKQVPVSEGAIQEVLNVLSVLGKWMVTKRFYVNGMNLGLIGTRSFESLVNQRYFRLKGDSRCDLSALTDAHLQWRLEHGPRSYLTTCFQAPISHPSRRT
ncbi:hypothetical protein AHAS_Ahas20G0171000 [Arachis hypogaea]